MSELDTLVFNLGTASETVSSDKDAVQKMEAEDAVRRSQRRSKEPVKIRLRKLTDNERKELERMMDHVAVHDYGEDDDYNLTDSEKESRQTYYQEFSKLRNIKRKINKLDEYVRAVRQCNKCMALVATQNCSYEVGDFWERAFNGDVTVVGITYPTYIGKNRKTIDWNYVRQFIDDPNKDLKELMNTINGVVDELESDDILPNPEIEERLKRAYEGHPTEVEVFVNDKKDRKKLKADMGEETQDAILSKIKEEAKKNKSRHVTAQGIGGVYDKQDDYEEIEKEDRKRGIWHDDDRPDITGPITSLDDLDKRYDDLVHYQYTHGSILYRDKYQSPQSAEYAEMCDALDEGGFNIRAFMDPRSETERKLEKIHKQEDKEHKKLKKRIEELDKRREARKSGKSYDELVGKKKKKDKKAKMKKKKAEKALLNASGAGDYSSLDEYSEDMHLFK